MPQPTRRSRAAIYCRISDDREGERLGVERQREDCLARAEREGWDVIEIFEDNDVGASTRSRKPRPAYKQLMKAAQDGLVDVILSYSNSRLTRRPLELEQLINLHTSTGVLLRTVVSGDADLSTADGRAVARTIAAWDAAEAERIGERVARAAKQRKEQGKHHGGFPPYGYDRATEGKLTINAERAAVVQEAARRVLAGESIYGIWTDLNRRGIKTAPGPRAPEGARWQSQALRRILTAPATVGCHLLDSGELRQVADPVLDRPTWDRLREVLHDDRRWQRSCPPDWSSRRKYPMSGLLTCGACGHALAGSMRSQRDLPDGTQRPGVVSFICNTAQGGCGKIRVDYPPVEKWVLDMVFARLDVPSLQEALSTREERADDDELRQRIRDDERRLEGLDDQHADGVLDNRRYRRQVDRLTQRIATARGELAEAQRTTFVIDTNGRSLRAVWSDHDATWQRTLLGHLVEKVVIEPHPAGATTHLSQRRGEDAQSYESRRKEHQERILFQRVRVSWKQ
ncbi:Site-specific DNA recombinase [Modestobacter sp. DSM 44400]|uniref:recombinase family protein n=1 Tax=Modestobacter sp. DSM 44400 TaxID=1550230 RepID=UPI000894BB53|nr:recombinase family protein [Modestobacter sp. DSM 44400]SDY89546.1 Site-specific DNA recombinase [Modestobacter sp. DSM 44400]